MEYRIEKYINSIEIDTWHELDKFGEYNITARSRSIYCGDGQGDFEKRSHNTTVECLENYMIYCSDQLQLAMNELLKLKER
jgi:hypothetical protein